MEVRNWKKVLVLWVTECGFVAGNYFSLEQTDIDEFYKNFRSNHKLVQKTEPEGNIISFLKDQYPEYSPLLDDENTISSTEYIYVYSLLLHFSCVKYPETNFHDICKRLSVSNQRHIAAFFNELIDCQSISRDKLRQAIAGTSLKSTNSSGSGNDSHSSSNNSTGNNLNFPSSSFSRLDSPCRTSRYAAGNSSPRIVPPTPKSAMLEERTRELYNLRAQLETERYEKGLLEVQIKQNEEKIKKLNQDHKKLQQTIQDLRNDILTQNATESSSPNKDGEQMERRLCREVAQKEAEIAKLNEVLGNMKEEKSFVQEKLRFAEKQIVVCMDRITELDFKVDELTAELEQKDHTIKCLNENKLELEQFINETRSAGSHSRTDYLDASFSPNTDASGSSSSPENLARSVVDVQLREKEHENVELREELHSLRNSNTRLSDLIRKFTVKHAQEFNIATGIGSITAKEEENKEITLAECLDHLVDYVDRLGIFYKEEKGKVKTLQADLQAKQRHNDDLSRRLMEFEKEISVLQEQLKNLDHVNIELEHDKKRKQEEIERCEKELTKINEQKFELVTKLESLANDYDTHQHMCNIQRQDYVVKITKLESEIAAHEEKIALFEKENGELNDEATKLRNKIEALQQSMVNNADEIRTLNERIKSYNGELEAHDKTEKILKEKYEKILVQYEATKRDRRETADHLEAMRNKIAIKELEMSKLGVDINEVRKKNVELESRIDTLTTEFKTEKHNSELAISSRDERIQKLSEERDKLEKSATTLKSEQNLMQKELSESKEELAAVLKTLNALNLLLNTDHADDSMNLDRRLGNMVSNVRRLQEHKLELDNKLELMSFDHTETISKMEVMEDEMKNIILAKEELEANYKSLLEESDLKLKNAEGQIKIYEEDIDNLKVSLKQVTKEMENALQANIEEHTVRLMELGVERDRAVSSLKEQLNSAKEELSGKERDLQALLEQSSDVKKKLGESIQRLEAVQGEQAQIRQASAEKLKSLQEQLESVVSENKKLLQEIETFKAEHTKVHEKIVQADSALYELNCQLSQEVNSKTELSVKLQTSESRLFETEQKLERIMKEKSQTINGLKTAHESLHKAVEEKERLAKDVASFTLQIQREQEEKSALLTSLEQTADQLKLAICEKEQQAKILEMNSADLNTQIRDANELCTKLQTDLSAKEAQLQRLQEEQEHERDIWQTKLSEMMRTLAEQSIEQEHIDSALQQITTVVENHISLPNDAEKPEVVDELIKLTENDKDTQLGKLTYALNHMLHSISVLHNQLDQTEQKRQGAIEVLEKANDKLNTQLLSRNAEITELQQQLVGERKCSAVTEHLKTELHDLKKDKEKLKAEVVRLEHEIAVVKEQHQNAVVALERLRQEKQELKSELQRANENVTRLIQGSDALRQEKDSLVEQLQELRTQLTQTSVQHSSTETMVKNILQNSNTLERKLDSTEKELKLLRTQLQTLENKKEELAAENAKLRETQEANKKRIEKMAVKLGDTQARCSKSEHDNEKLSDSLNASKAAAEKLQREKSTLENDKQLLQERLSTAERNQQQLFNKVHQLEQVKASLEAEKKQLEASEADAKAKLTKLEKIRQSNEEKIRKLNYSLETTEASNVRLNHEIGAINSQLNELKHSISADHTAEQLKEAIQERDKALARANEFKALANKLQADAEHLQEQNSNISDQLSKISCYLQISQEKCDTLAQQLRDLEMDMCALKEEKTQIENEHLNTCAKLKEYEIYNENLRTEREEKIVTLEAQLEQLRKELCIKTEEISMLQTERDKLRNGNDVEGEELEQLRKRLSVAEAVAESEQKANTQLRLDNQILQAKYRESKQRLQEETKASEERIKENRLEMEGKLDKMKNKMDGPNSLDDSMSALLSTTAGGCARKKLTGITNYKRPGPPTPGKHGGRLSLGSSEPPREILKEVNDHGSTTKTPVRFSFFTSKFSMGNSNLKDETSKIPVDLLKAVQKKNFEAMCLKSPDDICTSTPRKSKSHFDRRCLFDQFMALSGPSMLSLTVGKCSKTNIANTTTPPAILSLANVSAFSHVGASQSHLKILEQQRVARKRRSSLLRLQIGRRLKRLPTSSPLSSETPSTGTPQTPSTNKRLQQQMPLKEGTTGTTTSATSAIATTTTASSGDALGRSSGVGGRHRRPHKRDRGPRLSLYACGSSIRTPNRTKLREQMRKKAHKQRRDNFNRGRGIQMDNRLRAGQGFDSARESEDNNNSHAYRLNATIVLSKKCEHPEEYDIPEYTSNYFSEIISGTTEIIEETSAEAKTISANCHETNISADHAYDSNVTQLALDEITTQHFCENSEDSDAETTTNTNNENDSNDESSSTSLNTSLPVERSLTKEGADEPSTADEIEQFDARCKHFEELAAHTASAAPFTVTNIEFDVVPTTSRHSQRTVEKRHSTTYTLLSQRATRLTLAGDLEIKAIPSPMLVQKNLEIYNEESQITLSDVVRLWSSIWVRMDQQLQLTVILAVFAPIIAVIYLVFSQYA